MVNTEAFVRRLEKILEHYGLSASAFADQVGVQRSGISHLLSGRNKPSLEFVMKVIHTFPEVNLYWLLNGKGSFPAPPGKDPNSREVTRAAMSPGGVPPGRQLDKIILFYSDGSFETYTKTHDRK